MTTIQIISQIVNAIGSGINMIAISFKSKAKFLIGSCIGNLFVATALGLLNLTMGMMVQIIFVIQAIINYFFEKKYNKYPKWLIAIYVIVPCVLLICDYKNVLDILPVLAGIFFPLALVSKGLTLRTLNLLSVIVWIPYNFIGGQYVGAITCTILSIVNLIAIVRYDILKQEEKVQNN